MTGEAAVSSDVPVIVGAGSTRFGMFTDVPLRDLAARAADRALADSGLGPDDVALVVFGNAAAGVLTGQEMIRGQVSLSGSRLAGRPLINVENACASSSSALHLAGLAVSSGRNDVVVVVGAEKMTGHDRSLAPKALATGLDVSGQHPADRAEQPRPVFMEIYAEAARSYVERTDATPHDFALVAAKASRNASLNPLAQARSPLSPEEILADRMIVPPLTRPMCSSIGDGAVALVVCSPDFAARRGLPGVRILGSAVGAGTADDTGDVVERAVAEAYERSGVGPEDVDVAEIHDAAASAEPIVCEQLGLAKPGEGARLVRGGGTDLGGECTVNPSGGLLGRGHPIGATGLAQLAELVQQLRGRAGARQVEDARIGLAQNAGGHLGAGPAACVVTVLGSA